VKSRELDRELELLGGSRADLERLRDVVEQRIDSLEAKKKAAKKRAEADVREYTDPQWARSWFRRDEIEAAERARARDIFDRPERRALDAAEAQKKIIDAVLALDSGGPSADPLREAYREIAVSVAMNGELGVMAQVGKRIRHALEKHVFPFVRERRGTEASNLAAATEEPWRSHPARSAAWRPRAPGEVTPDVLFRGPWFRDAKPPKLPAPDETWDLVELRSQKADGGHASIEIGAGDDVVKLKLHTDPETHLWVEPAYARLLWAMGWETDPQYLTRDVRLQPRAFLAAFASIATIGLHVGRKADAVIPGRPPRGLSFPFNGMEEAPGAGWITVRYRDGREEEGRAAIASLSAAIDDRARMDAMESVAVKRAYVEVPRPGKWKSIGPWSFDTPDHVDDREVRALSVVAVAWLGFDDIKFNNLRLDVLAGSPAAHALVVADVGITQRTTELSWEVGVRLDGRFLHPDTNPYTIKAFDRTTVNDAKWGVSRIGQLTEEQILACAAAGAFDDAALAVFVEKLLARRDELVKTFGLDGELGLLRPSGPNRSPAPRSWKATG
jgi:hypothetical protein